MNYLATSLIMKHDQLCLKCSFFNWKINAFLFSLKIPSSFSENLDGNLNNFTFWKQKSAWSPKGNFVCLPKIQEESKNFLLSLKSLLFFCRNMTNLFKKLFSIEKWALFEFKNHATLHYAYTVILSNFVQ
jgi:hypothetical protein